MFRYLIPSLLAGLGACHGAYRFAYWLGTNQPSVFGIKDAYPSLLLWSGFGAAAGVAIADLLARQQRRRERGRLLGYLHRQMGRGDLSDESRAVIAGLYQELGHHRQPIKDFGG